MSTTSQEKRFLTAKEAESLLNDGKRIHTFRNPAVGMMLSADWDRKEILKLFKKHSGKIEVGGAAAKSMKHALVVFTDDNERPLFIENNKEKMDEFDPETATLKSN